jgi:hypothetical protein
LALPLDGRFEDGRACWRFRGSGGMRELRVSGNLRVNNVDVLRAAALAGLSIALLPAWCVARELAADRLSRGLPQWQVTPTTFDRCIYAAYQRRPHLPPQILAFVDILAQVLRGGCWRRSSPARRPRIFSPRASLLLGGHYSQACPDGSCSPRLRSRRGHAGAGEAVAGPFAYARPGALGRARQGGRREADGKQTP